MKKFVGMLCIVLCSCVLVAQVPEIAKSNVIETIQNQKYYIHTVQAKETVFAIARAYGVSHTDIIAANPGSEGGISIGQALKIPIVQQVQATTTITKIANNQPAASSSTMQTHIVKSGETLFALSRQYQVTTAEILAANPGMSETLSIDQVVQIPSPTNTSSTKAVASQTKPAQQTPAHTYQTHVFAQGETLQAIAKRFYVPIEVLYMVNPTLEKQSPTVGTKIQIPVDKEYVQKKYYYYTVTKGDFFGEIAQKFFVTDEELQVNNPQSTYAFREGLLMQIPINESNRHFAVKQALEKKTHTYHTIAQGETLYALCRRYGVTEQELMQANAGLSSNLSLGAIIKIPYKSHIIEYVALPIKLDDAVAVQANIKTADKKSDKKPEKQQEVQTVQQEILKLRKHKDSLHIVLMLPLFLDMNTPQAQDVEIVNKPKDIFPGTYPFLEYYEGVLLALDSLKQKGISVTLEVYDSNKDTTSVRQILSKIKPERVDLIIGPVFTESFLVAAAYARKHKIPIVSPLSSEEMPIKNNPFVVQVNSPQRYRYQEMVKFTLQYPNANVLLVYNSIDLEQSLVNDCKKAFTVVYADSIKKQNIQIKEIYFPRLGIEGVEKALSQTDKNIIIVFSRNQAFVNNLVTKLYQFSKRRDIHVIGLPMWEKYENLELDFLFELQFQFATNGNIDYSRSEVKSFIEKYRAVYKTEPTKFCFQGYDQMLYFAEALSNTRGGFLDNIIKTPKVGLHDYYVFIREEGHAGIVNTSVQMVLYTKLYERKLWQPKAKE